MLYLRRYRFENVHGKRIVAPRKAVVIIQAHELSEYRGIEQFPDKEERHGKPRFAALADMHNLAQIACVCAPTFGALLVRDNFHKREIIHRRAMPYHFQPIVETVVLLICRFFPLFQFFKFEHIFALFPDFGNIDHAELKAVRKDVVFDHFPTEPQSVEIDDMRMAGITVYQTAVTLEKVRVPKREITYIRYKTVRPNGIVRYDKRRLYDINEIQLCVCFDNFPHIHDFQFIVVCKAVSVVIVTETEVIVIERIRLFQVTADSLSVFGNLRRRKASGQMPNILAASSEVINLVPRHGIAERVFEVYPREIRELQIVFEYLFKGFVLEHHGLRQGNIRQHGRFLFAHCAAHHKHDRAGVDKAAVFHLIVIEDGIADFLAPTVDKEQCKQYPTPNGDKGYCRP